MKLGDWLKAREISEAEFGRRIGKHRATVGRWCTGESHPGKGSLGKVLKATNGEVTANDFMDDLPGDPAQGNVSASADPSEHASETARHVTRTPHEEQAA